MVDDPYSWFATTWQGGHVGGQYNRIFFSRSIYIKIEFSSEKLNAFVLDHQQCRCDVTCKPAMFFSPSFLQFWSGHVHSMVAVSVFLPAGVNPYFSTDHGTLIYFLEFVCFIRWRFFFWVLKKLSPDYTSKRPWQGNICLCVWQKNWTSFIFAMVNVP